MERAERGTTILLEDGVYRLDGHRLAVQVPGLVLHREEWGAPRVVIQGRGIDKRMEAIFVNAPQVTLADLTISQVGYHGIHVRGGDGTWAS